MVEKWIILQEWKVSISSSEIIFAMLADRETEYSEVPFNYSGTEYLIFDFQVMPHSFLPVVIVYIGLVWLKHIF